MSNKYSDEKHSCSGCSHSGGSGVSDVGGGEVEKPVNDNNNLLGHSHDHSDDEHNGCGHSHHHHHHHDNPVSYNHGILKKTLSMAGSDNGFLDKHRNKVILAAAGTLAAIEYHTASTSIAGTLAMVFATTAVAHDASEDLLESTGKLKDTHNISSGVVGMGVGLAHTMSEGFLSASAQMSGYQDVAISSTMGSNVSHIPLMAGMAGVIGALSIDKYSAYKMNAVFMGGITGAFGYQIATGDFNPYLSAGSIGAGALYLIWRVRAGQTCAVHGDACGHSHDGEKDETDYISFSYWSDLAKKIKGVKLDDAVSKLTQSVKSVKDKISNMTLLTRDAIGERCSNLTKALSHENVLTVGTSLAALGLSAHVLGDNVIKLAEQGGLSATATGATVAALAFALPELILTAKAAWKKDGEMAWGAVTGCTIATVGIVGGYQGLNGFDIPASLSTLTQEGQVQMGAFLGSAAAIIAATHPTVARQFAKADNMVADWLERQDFVDKANKVSNWLRNDGTKLSKVVAAPMLAAAITYYATNTQPNCHWHGNDEAPHCIGEEVELPDEYSDLPVVEF